MKRAALWGGGRGDARDNEGDAVHNEGDAVHNEGDAVHNEGDAGPRSKIMRATQSSAGDAVHICNEGDAVHR
jgi:hypothetical protein